MEMRKIQEALRNEKISGWLFCDFHNRDRIAYEILGLDFKKPNSRRWFYYIPSRGKPKKLVSAVEKGKLDDLPGRRNVYVSWKELHGFLGKILGSKKKIAMQYSPKNNVPTVSFADAGTVELVRSFGHKVVSSAGLVQSCLSVIGGEGYKTHKEAALLVDRIRAEAFGQIGKAIRENKILTEYDVQQYIVRRFAEEGLIADSPPIVGTNEHPADPHFELSPENARPFKIGDTFLVDLWAKRNTPGSIYYDITWVGYIGSTPPEKYRRIFEVVSQARDTAVQFVKDKFEKRQPCYGWQVDDAARNIVKKAGYGKYFVHRTGHSIDEEGHGSGVNIDNLETRDDRKLMTGSCFSIEPGIYLEGEMAVRSEINVFIREGGVPEVTSEVQKEIVLIDNNFPTN